ncbi:MAG: hypothetical protein ACR2JF_11765 [Iamia sp.]
MSGAGPEPSDPAGRVIGIDAAGKRGWAAVLVDEAGFVDAEVGTLETVIAWAEPISVIAVDIPIDVTDVMSQRVGMTGVTD